MLEDEGLKFSASTDVTDHPASPRHLAAWGALQQHACRLRQTRIDALFREDADRFGRFSLSFDQLLADFSKQAIDTDVLVDLMRLAEQARVADGVRSLFDGEEVNFTEGRPALHMAMRGSCPMPAGDADVVADTRSRLRAFAAAVLTGAHVGCTGKPFRHVVNLGIGGSDLGPRMATEALVTSHATGPVVRFVANIDPNELEHVLADACAETTLFIVSSKSFTTAETLANANAARQWLRDALGQGADITPHLAAVSNAVELATAFGIAPERVFPLPEWVGGRYSVWSPTGLPLMLAIGVQAFEAFLAGARAMDAHFRSAPLHANLPVTMALIGLWNTDFLDIETLAVLPYANGLRSFPGWLQQLDMESNGKRCLRDGSTSEVHTAPIVWGGAGTIGQHAFHQLFYQGTRRTALDFIVLAGSEDPREQALLHNALAQSAALMGGRDLDAALRMLRARGVAEDECARLAPHLVCPGNQPGTTLLLPRLDPYRLGQLMALYEHKVFVQGWIWGINSFDQFGVELGKDMARSLASGGAGTHDPSTTGLLAAAADMRRITTAAD